jgi:flagellar assembly protein FliH
LVIDQNTLSNLCPRIKIIDEVKSQENRLIEESPEDVVQQILLETEAMVKELVEKARVQALELMQHAQQEAEAIVEEAQEKRDAIFEETYSQAYEEASLKALADVEEARLAISEATRELEEKRALTIIQTEREVISMALGVAEKLIRQELTQNPQLVQRYVQDAISKAVNQEELTVFVNPESALVINEYIQELSQVDSVKRKITIVSDESLIPGSCVVETALGKIDYRFERQIEDLRELFEDVLVNG